MDNVKKFLDTYKKFEDILRGEGIGSVLDYENSLSPGKEQSKLKVCRIIRNYLSHEDTVFVGVTAKMIGFIEEEVKSFDKNEVPVKKKMYSSMFTASTTFSEIGQFIMSKKLLVDCCVPIFDAKSKSVIGVIMGRDIFDSMVKSKKVSGKAESIIRPAKGRITCFDENTSYKSVVEQIEDSKTVAIICKKNGENSGWIYA